MAIEEKKKCRDGEPNLNVTIQELVGSSLAKKCRERIGLEARKIGVV